jgi:hypothetical protein
VPVSSWVSLIEKLEKELHHDEDMLDTLKMCGNGRIDENEACE